MSASPYGYSFDPPEALRVPTPRPPVDVPSSKSTTSSPPAQTRFEQLLESSDLPEPGPAYFEARRALWHTPIPHDQQPEPLATSVSRQRLEELLNTHEGKLDEDDVWYNGLDKVWKGLITGARLKRRLPLRYLIQILQAGWVRDGTWPKGGVAPDPDDELEPTQEATDVPSAATSAMTSLVALPSFGPARQHPANRNRSIMIP